MGQTEDMERKGKILLVAVSLLMACTAVSCKKNKDEVRFEDVVTRTDFRSVYGEIGGQVTIDMVTERGGLAYATVDGKEYELGLDFLSMAMVYNTRPVGTFTTAEAVYNEWWRLYIQRWNYLVPEVPLYSNQFYDVYNGKIDRLNTNPYWSVTDAIIGARVTGENSVILGSNSELSGMFRNSGFGKSSPGAADLAVEELVSGYSTVNTDMGGVYRWADTEIVRRHAEEENEDGTKTFTVEIAKDLRFSDGSPIRAENYLVGVLIGSSKVMKEAGGGDAAGLTLVGYEDFNAYTGEGDVVPFAGVRLLDDYTFSVTVKKEYADYYYALQYG
ncbi:MAG: hypothetical protein J6S04_05785, partial [Clostridia bacterium]|nr:hypothetical protein [Clostridia bacterium]